MMYRPVMDRIDRFDPRRSQPQPIMQPQTQPDMQPDRQKVAEALMSPQRGAFVYGRNFEGMFAPAQEQQKQEQQRQMMQMPQNAGQGIAQMGNAFAYQQRQKQGAFPKAPGNNPMSPLGRIFGMFNKQGLR